MNIKPWLIHTVTTKKRTGATAKQDPTYGDAVTFKARIEKKRKRVIDSSGNEVVSEVAMATLESGIVLSDRFWFPSIAGEAADDVADTTKARRPIQIERATNKRGSEHLVMVYF